MTRFSHLSIGVCNNAGFVKFSAVGNRVFKANPEVCGHFAAVVAVLFGLSALND